MFPLRVANLIQHEMKACMYTFGWDHNVFKTRKEKQPFKK